MAPNRSKSLYAIKECSTCGSWYTKECCSIGNLNDQIIVPVPDSSLHCAVCGTPVDGPYCHGCTLIRMKFEKDLFTYCVDNGVFQNFQDTSESSNDNTNVVNAPREPSVVDQDPGVNISQNPPQIDHNCCYECGDSLNGIFCQQCICESCGKGAHFGYNCPPKDPIISELEPCYNQNFSDNNYPQNSPNFSQQYLVCAYCGGPHFDYQCQPLNQNFYEPNPSYNSNFSGFDQPQPPKYSIDHQEALIKMLEKLEEIKQDQRKKREDMSSEEMRHEQQLVYDEIRYITNELEYKRFRGEEINEEYERDCENRIDKLKIDFNEWGSEIRKKEQAYNEERNAAARRRMLSITFDDDDDSIPLGDIIARSKAITPDLPIEEPDNFLSMGDEHLDTIPSVEYLVPIPRESEGLSDNGSECDMPVCDESSPIFTVFSNPLFDSNDNFSSDDESLSEEEIQKDEFNSFSNPLYDIDDEIITNESNLLSKKDLDEIILIPSGIGETCFNAESDLVESLLNRDSPIDSTKTDSIFDEFSFPRLPEEHNSENVDTIIESLSYSPIPVEDSVLHLWRYRFISTSNDVDATLGIESRRL
ncbi:hypothetical protein Tco_1549201 [Tanacetum coccineum]